LNHQSQVGDFVDSQDAAGKWYEALVREVAEDTVTVHYFGWATKWNGTIRRRKDVEMTGVSAVSMIETPAGYAYAYRVEFDV
jgi:hypothetical protein